jgi:amino acid adenylation domain-containing protein/non-ribosomal peptide synthase protein (TIGR01720 family)
LISGSQLIFAKPEGHKDQQYLKQIIEEQKITMLHFVPSMLEVFLTDINPSECPSLKKVLTSGEALKPSQVKLFKEKLPGTELHNLYGPTEAAIDVTYWSLPEKKKKIKLVPIGKPVSNTQILILNSANKLLPVGCEGEIHIGGIQVARGYLNNETLTKEKFIINPFDKSRRLYKTGDKGRWLSDGNIEYLGRLDDQLKIRGFRIEPGEIESAIAGSKLTKQSVVIARADQSGSKRLIAYVVGNKMYQKQELLNYLRSKLPDYMIPSVIMELTSIPLTANGKVDKRALPEVEHNQSKQYVAPSNEMQRQLCVIWQELLELKQVGITDNFFELGGHSLLAMRVISLVRRQLGIELRVKDLFKYPSIAELSKQLSRQKHGTLLPAIDKQERPAHIPLSFSQERLWFIDQLEGSIQYHIPAVLELKGKLNIEALNFGFKEIINRHEILRTSIVQYQGQAYQQIHASLEWQIEQIKDYKTQTQEELESSIKALINQPYDLSKDSMLRAYLIERTDQDHILVVTLHHIVSDGWSTSIIVNELAELYRSFEQKVPVLLKTLQIQYADYAIWQRNYIQGELLDTKLAYWKQKLQNASPLELPTDYARPAVQGVRGLTEEFEIEASLTQQIKQLSQNSNTTVFMTLLSAFKVMLYRYTNQQDITVGTPIAGRQQLETESLIGYFVNTLALRSDLSSQTKFSELLAQVRTTTLEAYEHQEIPFEKVVEAVVKERDLSRSPLFQVMFVMNNTPEVTGIKLGDVETTEYRFKNDMTQFDLSMTITQINGKMDASIEYCTDLYKTGSIRRMVQHYLELLKSIVQNPDKEVGGLRMLSYTEQNQILREFNTTATAYPQDKLVTELFETQAAASPQKIALSFENEQISYQELNAKSNQLAHYLRQRGAKAEMLIPICLERGPKMIIGILGILKSGAAYVPIDSDYPQSRISYILNDTEARLVVSDQQIKAKIIGRQTEIIDIESDWSEIAKQPETNLERTVGLNNLAYLIYTSGSTGEPKGIMIEHKSMLNYVLMFKEYFSVSENDYVLQQYSIAFDASLEEIFPTLITGATLGIIKEGGRDIETIKENIENNKATILSVTPAILEALNKRLTHTGKLRYVTVGGDVLQDSAISSLRGKVNIVNGYGPSEATIAVTLGEINAQPEMVNSQARTVKKMFEAQVRATPDLPAVSFNGKQLTYFELNEKANKLANYLIKQGVKSESLIPILINRSFEMIIGILGIMKSGAAYVPINTNFPLERIKNILNDLQCELVLSNHEFGAKISSIETLKIIELDREWAEIEHCSNANLIGTTHPSKLAYVIYTSGSTGKPKGVMIEHQGVVNLIRSQLNYFGIAQGERILQFSDYSFDASVEQIFLALTSGSTLVLFEEGLQFKPDDFEQFIVDEKITHLHTTPGFLENLRITDHRYLKRIIAGGDVCKQELADYWKGKLDFYNEYGPTETTVTAIEYSHPDFEKILYRSLPIGKGVSNTSIYILGADYQIQPIGVTGEICIGGVQVARGYLNNDAITKEKFISNPFSKDPTARLYKTGDLGRWLEDGNIEFLGRIDEQVKIRGYRIELGEIENVLNQSGLVNQAVIMAKLNHQNSKQLVGYIEPKAVFSKERIIAFLRGKLPEYMVPAIWVEMKKIPVTLNGKIDRKALPDPNFEELSNEHYIAPRNEIEEELANIWKDLLGLEKVGVYDNFFELGGDSILTIQVVSRAGRLGYNLQAKDLFLHQTIHKLSHILTERKETESLAEQGVLTGNAGLLPIQKWFFSKEHKDVSHYNQSVILKLNKAVSEQELSIAMNKILEAHDALRFKYVKQKLEWIQTYSDINSSIKVEDLSQLSKDDFEFSLNVLAESYQKSLDIEQGELVKWIFIKTPQEDDANRFIMIVHHLAIDGVSWRIILEDLDLMLRNINLNETDKEVKKTSSYRQWSDELMRLGQTDRIKNQFNYWQNVISFYSPLTFENVSITLITAKDISRFSNFLSQTQTDHLLHSVSKAYNTEINDILLLAFAEVFTRFSKRNDLVIGLEGHGRELEASSIDISRTVGWFTNLYPVHLNIGNETNIGENIKSIKEQLRQVPAKGMGFGILKYLNELDELKGNDPWDIVFNYLGQLDNTGANSEWFKPSAESIGSDIGEEQIINEKISLNCYVHDGKLIVNWNYSKLHFEASIIKDFAEQFISNLEMIISHCLESQNQGNTSNTPSDFGLGSQVSIDELDRFLNERL